MNFFRRIQYNSPVILSYAIICLFVLLLGRVTEGVSTTLFFSVYKSPLTDPLFYVRLLGHVFGHASFAHYYNNFVIILLVGPMLEEKYGARNLIIMMAATSVLTGLIYGLFFDTVLLGASGIVFMFILLSSFVNIRSAMIPLTLILVIAIFLGREVFEGAFGDDNISQITHVVGGICGAVLGFVINSEKFMRKKRSPLP